MQRLALKTETINKILDRKKNVLIMPSINKDMPLLSNSNCVIQELWKVTILGNNLIIKYRSKIPDKIIKNCDTKMREKIENKKTYLYKKKFSGYIRPALLDEKLASMFLYLKEPIFKRIQDLSIDEIVSYGIKRYSNDHRTKTEFIKAWDKDMAERRRTIYCYENNKAYKSIQEASEQLSIGYNSINLCVLGKQNSANKLHFIYLLDLIHDTDSFFSFGNSF